MYAGGAFTAYRSAIVRRYWPKGGNNWAKKNTGASAAYGLRLKAL